MTASAGRNRKVDLPHELDSGRPRRRRLKMKMTDDVFPIRLHAGRIWGFEEGGEKLATLAFYTVDKGPTRIRVVLFSEQAQRSGMWPPPKCRYSEILRHGDSLEGLKAELKRFARWSFQKHGATAFKTALECGQILVPDFGDLYLPIR